ncbi:MULTISPECIES: alpha/beta fold hydrolase [Salinibaculum]|uniref:alpha/beta fold hydrolase n=1 Tax=Salinibaculum TaxID=2732368 RepID=UPI0030D4AA4F
MFGPFTATTTLLARENYAEFAPFQPDIPGSLLEARYTNGASAFADVAGARVHYRDQGPEDAPTLLALHGVYSSLHTWDGWQRALGDDVRLVRLDLPGFGLTGPNEQREYSLSHYVETLEEFCEALGLEDVAVAGNSLGGAIGWRFAATYPERVEKLLLLDAGRQNVVPRAARLFSQPGWEMVPRYVTPRSSVRSILRDAYGDPSKLTSDVVRRYHDLVLRTGNRRAVLQLVEAARPAPMEPMAVECPTLVQWGEEDDWLPPALGERFVHEIPDATMETYPGVGHVPMEEAPAETAADAAAFLGIE